MRERERPLGKVLTLDQDPVLLQPDDSYATAGILSYGRGLFERPVLKGSETRYTKYYRLRQNQFVYSKLFAWEGALGVVDEHFDEMFVSQEFPTFAIDMDQALPSWLALLCRWPETWARVQAGETGLGGRRKRVHPESLLDVVLPFPTIAEQRRIVDLIANMDTVVATASQERVKADVAIAVLREKLFAEADPAPLAEICSIESRLVDPTLDAYADLPHVGVERIEAATGRLLPCQTAREDGVTSGKFLFTPDDIVLSKIRPNLRKAVWPRFVGLSSADAYPLRARPGVDKGYLFEVLLSDMFVTQAVARSGRTKMPKINRTELFSIEVPFPSSADQYRAALLLSQLREVRDWSGVVEDKARTLRVAMMTQLISGHHTVPRAYDSMLDSA